MLFKYNPEVSIGRVVTSPAFRASAPGRKIMELAIAGCEELFGKNNIRIGAQTYALAFYASLGFISDGGVYDEGRNCILKWLEIHLHYCNH